MYLQPVPATTQAPAAGPCSQSVHTINSGHFCSLPRSLVAEGGIAEDTQSLCNLCRLPAMLAKDQPVVDAMNARGCPNIIILLKYQIFYLKQLSASFLALIFR